MTTWFRTHSTQLLLGIALAAIPLIFFVYTDVSWYPLNPHEHIVQNGLAYLFLLLFSYFNHTVFVPRWFLHKQYLRYALVAISCVLVTAYLPYRIEQSLQCAPAARANTGCYTVRSVPTRHGNW